MPGSRAEIAAVEPPRLLELRGEAEGVARQLEEESRADLERLKAVAQRAP